LVVQQALNFAVRIDTTEAPRRTSVFVDEMIDFVNSRHFWGHARNFSRYPPQGPESTWLYGRRIVEVTGLVIPVNSRITA